MQSIQLIGDLIRIALESPGSRGVDEIRPALARLSTKDFAWILQTCQLHRVTPLVGCGIARHGLEAAVPPVILSEFSAAHRRTRLANVAFMHTLARVLRALDARGVTPVIWKGAVLADTFYPDPGTRAMGDVDLAVAVEQMPATTEAFGSLGFTPQENLSQEDAVYFAHPSGLLFDVHRRVRMFEGHDPSLLTIDVPPRHMDVPSIRVLEPNAMFALLIHHLHGHLHDVGYLLLWLLDLAFVLNNWGNRLDTQRITELLPEPEHRLQLSRAMQFLATEFGVDVPDALRRFTTYSGTLTLSEVLRNRRLAQWRLPSLRGWARLSACRLGLWPRGARPYPHWDDLVRWPGDKFHERSLLKRARRES